MDDNNLHGQLIDTSIPRRMPEFIIGACLLLVFVSLTVLQVVTRYVLNAPLPWTEELAAYLLIWMVFIGAIGVHRKDTHLRVEMLDEWAPPPVVAAIRLIYDIIIFAVLVLLVKSGWDLYQSMRFDKLPALRWPIRNIIIIAPIASAIMVLYTMGHVWERVKFLMGRENG
ncbi:TRAP transporter small permease [Alphaproteobacteria bacterium LSUCC0719]